MKRLFNIIWFQLFWFACVLGGNEWAVISLVVYFAMHACVLGWHSNEVKLVLLFGLLGVAIDGMLILNGVIVLPYEEYALVPPIWLICLWCGVATLFANSLVWLQGRYFTALLLGMVFPPISYFVGAEMTEQVELAMPLLTSVFWLSLCWGLLLPLGAYLSGGATERLNKGVE
ncbi:DUF2878 domain-containing protein [Marinomonas epiphytica]